MTSFTWQNYCRETVLIKFLAETVWNPHKLQITTIDNNLYYF